MSGAVGPFPRQSVVVKHTTHYVHFSWLFLAGILKLSQQCTLGIIVMGHAEAASREPTFKYINMIVVLQSLMEICDYYNISGKN